MSAEHTHQATDVFELEIASIDEVSLRIEKIWNDIFLPKYIYRPSILDADGSFTLRINSHALAAAIGNALIDIERWCRFHLKNSPHSPKKPDRHKYAGFLAKWLAKERPVFLESEADALPEQLYRINALFAVTVLQAHLDYEIPDDLWEELFYILHFRDEKGETLALLAYCGEEMGRLSNLSAESN